MNHYSYAGPIADIDLDRLRRSYRCIADAKSLKKNPAPELHAMPNSTITLGIIFALRSALPLEDIAEELNRLLTAAEKLAALIPASAG